MLKIIVKSAVVRERTNDRGTMRIQQMALETGADFPVVFEQIVETALQPGEYEFVPIFRTGAYNRLELNPFEFNYKPLSQKS